jgi:O-antigen ligase
MDTTYPSDKIGWLVFAAFVGIISVWSVFALAEFAGLFLFALAALPIVLYAVFKEKALISYALIFFSLLTFDQEAGTNLQEALYYAIIASSVAIIIPWLFISGNLTLKQGVDKAYLVFFLFLLYAVVLGFFMGGVMKNRIDDIALMFPIFTYFIFRDHLQDDKKIKTVVVILVVMMLLIAVRNYRNYQQILVEAVMDWQVQKARVAKNEVFLMAGAVGFFILQAYQTKWIPRIFYLGMFGFMFGGLILTQSRGYWLAFILSVLVFLVFTDSRSRYRAILTSSILGSVGVVLAFIFYYDAMMTVLQGLAYRFSLTGGGAIDPSLLERVYESQNVFDKIIKNPFAGYGVGVTYSRYSLIAGYWGPSSYVHNGYLAIWFKTGLFGLLAAVAYVWMIARTGYKLHKQAVSPFARTIGIIVLSQVIGMMLVNITSPQFLGFDSMLMLSIMGVLVASLADRYLENPTIAKDLEQAD